MNLLTAAKAALEALETCDWNDNEFPDDTQYFDRFAVSEAATKLRAAIAEAEKQEDVAALRAENESLRKVFDAAENLVKVKGRFHSEQAYGRLVTAVAGMKVEE